jgi:hypothetical protein
MSVNYQLSRSGLCLSAADDEFGEKTVSVLLDGEESEMIFIDHPSVEMSVSRVHISQQRTEKL